MTNNHLEVEVDCCQSCQFNIDLNLTNFTIFGLIEIFDLTVKPFK